MTPHDLSPGNRIRRDLETFLWWYVPACLLVSLISSYLIPTAFKDLADGRLSVSGQTVLWLKMVTNYLPGIVAAFWLGKRQHPGNGTRVIWVLFGLMSPLWAVGLYLLAELLRELRPETAAKSGEAGPHKAGNIE